MSHWAELDNSNIVIKVVVGPNNEDDGESFFNSLPGRWIKTSYNTFAGVHKEGGIPLRKNYAGIGYLYDPIKDAFIPPKTYNSWVLDSETCQWKAPVEYPNDGKNYIWSESDINWIELVKE